MNTGCSITLLESALAGNLPAQDETSLHRHLEACEACSAALERMAGGPAWCQEAASLLTGDELDAAVATSDQWSEVDFTVEHLEPADEPNVLGRLGGYDVLEVIGHGGMGVVLKGFDRELKRCVAIKVLSPNLARSSLARKRFAREAQAAAAVVHPHVLAIHQVQASGRLPFLVMPLVAGESLAERLTAQGTLELKEILRIGMQAAAGLAAAHEQGLVHRDVKPANILLEKGVERAVLTDFGLACAADDVTLTRWGTIAGTPQYMSPEQVRGEPLDGRSDLFSLGCVLYEMATGISPFRTDSVMATLRRLVDDAPQAMAALNPELPPWFIAIVDRLLEKDSSRRFGSAREVSELLEDCLAHVQQPAAVPLPEQLRDAETSASAERGRWSMRRWLAGAAFALALLLAGVVVVLELNKGTLTIESDADDVSVRITQGEAVVEKLTVTRAGRKVRVAAGTYIVEIEGEADGIAVENGAVTMQRGGTEIVRIVRRSSDKRERPDLSHTQLGPEAKTDKELLQGTWTLLETHKHGKNLADKDNNYKPHTLAITGNKIVEQFIEGGESKGTFELDSTRKPKEITIQWVLSQRHAIYKLEGDTLTICWNDVHNRTRPDEFRTTADSERLLCVYQRATPQAKLDLESQPKSTTTPRRLNYFTTGHSIKVACSADGKRIAVANGNPTRILQEGGTSRVQGNWKPTADILDAETGKIVVSLKLTTDEEDAVLAATERISHIEATALAFSPSGNVVAVGTSIGQVKLYTPRTGELIRSLDDEQPRIADKDTPESWKPLKRAMGSVASFAFSPDGSLLAVCGSSFGDFSDGFDGITRLTRKTTGPGRLKVWEVETETLRHDLVGHSHAGAVAFSPDGNLLASAGSWSADNERGAGTGVTIWNPHTGARIRTIATLANGGTHAVAFSPNSKWVAIGSGHYDNVNDTGSTGVSVAPVSSSIAEWQRTFPGHANPKAFSPDGKSVLVLSGQSMQFLDATTGTAKREIKSDNLSKDGRWDDFAVASQGSLLVIGAVDEYEGYVEVWDLGGLGSNSTSGTQPAEAHERATPPSKPELDFGIQSAAGLRMVVGATIVIDLYVGRDVFKHQDTESRNTIGKLVTSLNALQEVTVNIQQSGDGDAILVAIVRDPSGVCRKESQQTQKESTLRTAINEALRAGGVKAVRWEEEGIAVTNETQAAGKLPAAEPQTKVQENPPNGAIPKRIHDFLTADVVKTIAYSADGKRIAVAYANPTFPLGDAASTSKPEGEQPAKHPAPAKSEIVKELRELVVRHEQDVRRARELYAAGAVLAAEVLRNEIALTEAKIRLASAEGRTDDAIRLHDELVKRLEAVVKSTEELYRSGAAAASEVSRARKELAEVRIQREQARRKPNLKPSVEILNAGLVAGYSVASLQLTTEDEDAVLAATEGLPHFEVGPLAFSPDGTLLAIGTGLGQVKLFNARTGELILSLDDEQAKRADKKTPEKLKSLKRAMGSVRSLAFSPDGSLLAMCGESFEDVGRGWGGITRGGLLSTGPGRLKVWEVETGTLRHDLVGHSHAYAVAFSSDRSLLASAGSWAGSDHGSGVIVWDPQTGENLRTLAQEANGGTHAVAFSPIRKLVVIGSLVFDKENDTRSTTVSVAYPLSGITEWQRTFPGGAIPKAFSPDGKSIAVLCGRESIRFLDTVTGAVKHEIKAADSPQGGHWNDFAITPKGSKLAIGGVDKEGKGSVEIWDLEGLSDARR